MFSRPLVNDLTAKTTTFRVQPRTNDTIWVIPVKCSEFFSKTELQVQLNITAQMYTSMFEVYKNINIIPFAQKWLCQSHLKDGDTDALNLSMPEVLFIMIERHVKKVHLTGQLGNKLV